MNNKVWFYNQNLKPHGPFTLQEMRDKILLGHIGPEDLICDESAGDSWLPAREFSCFERSLFPALQNYILGQETNLQAQDWVVLAPLAEGENPRQLGPYSHADIVDLLRHGDILPSHHVWRSGLSGWSRLTDRPEFKEFILPSL